MAAILKFWKSPTHFSYLMGVSLFNGGRNYLEGHEDLVGRLIIGRIGAIVWLIGVINLLTRSPWPST